MIEGYWLFPYSFMVGVTIIKGQQIEIFLGIVAISFTWGEIDDT